MDCDNLEANLADCSCTYAGCSRKGKCCDCIKYHLAMRELPACAFSAGAELTYDRSFARFIKDNK